MFSFWISASIKTTKMLKASSTTLIILCLGACASSPIPNCVNSDPHPKLVVIGDSYSDTGNIAINNVVDFPNPFYQGRFSNGKLIADYLADHLATSLKPSLHTVGCRSGYNYAVGGGNVMGAKQQDMLCQVNKYLNRVSNTADPSAMYFIMLGGNDVRQMDTSLSASQVDQELDDILDRLVNQSQRLIDAGAQKLVIANSGDMGRLPGSLAGGNATTLTQYSNEFNVKFVNRITSLQTANPTITIRTFDLFNAMKDILDNPATFGFANAVDACIDIEQAPTIYVNGCTDSTINYFVFFDSIHATTATHRILADKLILSLP